jgi:Ca2+/Na+ antiporter
LCAAGWVLLIGEETEQARVLVALLVSIAFLTLQLAVQPYRKKEDTFLMALVSLALILVYICVLLIKYACF